jgi:hypothetical protein
MKPKAIRNERDTGKTFSKVFRRLLSSNLILLLFAVVWSVWRACSQTEGDASDIVLVAYVGFLALVLPLLIPLFGLSVWGLYAYPRFRPLFVGVSVIILGLIVTGIGWWSSLVLP